jgi:hypothetical protein
VRLDNAAAAPNQFPNVRRPGATERPHETSGATYLQKSLVPLLGCRVVTVMPRSPKWLRRKRREIFQYRDDGRLYRELGHWERVWMTCENKKCLNPSHMKRVTVWEMGRRYQKRVVTPAKERRKW